IDRISMEQIELEDTLKKKIIELEAKLAAHSAAPPEAAPPASFVEKPFAGEPFVGEKPTDAPKQEKLPFPEEPPPALSALGAGTPATMEPLDDSAISGEATEILRLSARDKRPEPEAPPELTPKPLELAASEELPDLA